MFLNYYFITITHLYSQFKSELQGVLQMWGGRTDNIYQYVTIWWCISRETVPCTSSNNIYTVAIVQEVSKKNSTSLFACPTNEYCKFFTIQVPWLLFLNTFVMHFKYSNLNLFFSASKIKSLETVLGGNSIFPLLLMFGN